MNFAAHSLLGLLVGALAALAVVGAAPRTLGSLSLPLLVPAAVLVLVYLGAVYPDIDLRGSIPRRRLLPYLRALAVGCVAVAGFYFWGEFVSLGQLMAATVNVPTGSAIGGAIGLVCVSCFAVFLVEPVLSVLTGAHRTWTHNIGVNALVAGVLALALWLAAPIGSEDRLILAVLPFAFVLGVAVHHVADGVS